MKLQPSSSSTPSNPDRVRAHFAVQSSAWGNRYADTPRSMADLDLALRRECVHRLLWPTIHDAPRTLRVLDVGCGTGDVLDGLPRDLMDVVGVDFVPEMAATAYRTHPGDRFLAADATALPFMPETMDAATSLGMLEYLNDPQSALRSIAGVLKPGAPLIVSFPNRRCLFRRLLAVERWCERVWHRIRHGLPANPARRDAILNGYVHRQWTQGEARRMLNDAGFKVEKVLLHTIGPWGRLGRHGSVIQMARIASRLFSESRVAAQWCASTMVFRAIKAPTGPRRETPPA